MHPLVVFLRNFLNELGQAFRSLFDSVGVGRDIETGLKVTHILLFFEVSAHIAIVLLSKSLIVAGGDIGHEKNWRLNNFGSQWQLPCKFVHIFN